MMQWLAYAHCYTCDQSWLYQQETDRTCQHCGGNAQVHEQLTVFDHA